VNAPIAKFITPVTPVIRVAILGAESSGKSTLAAALAAHYQTLWVPEYLREFVDTHQRVPRSDDQFPIARTQVERETAALALARRFLFCDTTPLMTAIYSRLYFDDVDDALAALVRASNYDATLVAAPDGPWVADGLQRESAAVRQHVHQQLLLALDQAAIPFLLVEGGLAQRLEQTCNYLDAAAAVPGVRVCAA
jgi:NadR type nicotinamide-nucleotide adenylyltransferase